MCVSCLLAFEISTHKIFSDILHNLKKLPIGETFKYFVYKCFITYKSQYCKYGMYRLYRPVGRAVMRSLLEQRSVVQHWTRCCQRLTILATFLRKELCWCVARQRIVSEMGPPTRYSLRRKAATIMKDLIWFEVWQL